MKIGKLSEQNIKFGLKIIIIRNAKSFVESYSNKVQRVLIKMYLKQYKQKS